MSSATKRPWAWVAGGVVLMGCAAGSQLHDSMFSGGVTVALK